VRYTQKVVIVGAGISGLACAFRLKQLEVPFLVLEASGRPGGVILTTRRNGCLFEGGPQCPRFPASVWELVRTLDLEREFIPGDPKAKRYILEGGHLHSAPFSPGGLLTTKLLRASSKLRILAEVFGNTSPPQEEESLAAFVQRKFGTEVLENLVDPLISTVFFGDAYRMGMQSAFPALVDWEKNHGSLVRGALRARASKRAKNESLNQTPSRSAKAAGSLKVTDSLPSLGSFRDGMGRLPERLAEKLVEEVRYGVAVESVKHVSGEDRDYIGWQIRTSEGENVAAEHLVLCVPAYEAARILYPTAPAVASSLGSIEYAPVHGMSAVYDRQQVRNPLDGFGFMVPRKAGLRTICTFWNSSLFPRRAQTDKVLITSFSRIEASESSGENDQPFAAEVEAENAMVLGIKGEPTDREVWTNSRALPQYNVGHWRTVNTLKEAAFAVRNLYLAGNYIRGRSIGDCVELAVDVARSIHSQLQVGSIQRTSNCAPGVTL